MRSSLRRRAAWSVPAVTVVAVAAGYLLPSTASASKEPLLPERSAAQLLADVRTGTVRHLSGTIVETARLGLPALPGANDTTALDWQTLVNGTHTARVWFDGPDRQRLALLGQLSESDVVHSGRDVWTYTSDTRTVRHTVLPEGTSGQGAAPEAKDRPRLTPQGAAAEALKAIDPTTLVAVDRTARVAGQPAYTLVLTPRDSRSTVRKVTIAIDAAHSVPLRVQVYGAANKPAFETSFTDVSFARPSAEVFRFTPPQGARVTHDLLQAPAAPTGSHPASAKLLGTGWTSVLEVPAPSEAGPPLAGPTGDTASVLNRLTSVLPNGDRLVRTALVNVLLARDGRVLVGAVSPAILQRAAAGHLG